MEHARVLRLLCHIRCRGPMDGVDADLSQSTCAQYCFSASIGQLCVASHRNYWEYHHRLAPGWLFGRLFVRLRIMSLLTVRADLSPRRIAMFSTAPFGPIFLPSLRSSPYSSSSSTYIPAFTKHRRPRCPITHTSCHSTRCSPWSCSSLCMARARQRFLLSFLSTL